MHAAAPNVVAYIAVGRVLFDRALFALLQTLMTLNILG